MNFSNASSGRPMSDVIREIRADIFLCVFSCYSYMLLLKINISA